MRVTPFLEAEAQRPAQKFSGTARALSGCSVVPASLTLRLADNDYCSGARVISLPTLLSTRAANYDITIFQRMRPKTHGCIVS